MDRFGKGALRSFVTAIDTGLGSDCGVTCNAFLAGTFLVAVFFTAVFLAGAFLVAVFFTAVF